MDVSNLDKKTVSLLAENFTLKQPEDMTLFSIVGSELRNTSLPNKGIQMTILMKRKQGNRGTKGTQIAHKGLSGLNGLRGLRGLTGLTGKETRHLKKF